MWKCLKPAALNFLKKKREETKKGHYGKGDMHQFRVRQTITHFDRTSSLEQPQENINDQETFFTDKTNKQRYTGCYYKKFGNSTKYMYKKVFSSVY